MKDGDVRIAVALMARTLTLALKLMAAPATERQRQSIRSHIGLSIRLGVSIVGMMSRQCHGIRIGT